nr:hypothetical protein [uncultured Rhodoferax sp.]
MQQQVTKCDEEYLIPGSETLMASTMALMTAHTQSACASHRSAMMERIVLNLGALSRDPMLSPGFQALAWSLRLRWQAMGKAEQMAPAAFDSQGRWHHSPEVLQ